ncbi:MAG: hypothetical protein WB586_10030 [Chthoniobacterales bacterium]
MRQLFVISGILLSTLSLHAERILEGYTVVNGKGYAFELKAPRGWVLDNDAAREQGLNVVFYPKDSSWDNGKAVCYVRVKTLDSTVRTIEDQVKDTLKNLRENGSPNAGARFVKSLLTQDASKAKVFYFSGDRFGNLEATAYIQTKNTIHFITLSTRDANTFQYSLPAFESLVTSYEDLTKPPTAEPEGSEDRN